MKRAIHYICNTEEFREAITKPIHLNVLAVYDDGTVSPTMLIGVIQSTKLEDVNLHCRRYTCTQTNSDRPFTIYVI